MNQTAKQMIRLGCSSKKEFEEPNALTLINITTLEVEQKLQGERFWKEFSSDPPFEGKKSMINEDSSNFIKIMELDGVTTSNTSISEWFGLRDKAKLTSSLEARVTRKCSDEVVAQSFNERELAWKVILPLREKREKPRKFEPKGPSPYQVQRILSKGVCSLQESIGLLKKKEDK